MSDIVLQTDIEYSIILIILAIFFVLGLKKKDKRQQFYPFSVDKDFSTAIKGIACVMILLGHYGKRAFGYDMPLPWGISRVVFMSAGNIALVWFMFFSGYGLSLKEDNKIVSIGKTWIQRVWKVYRPYLLVVIFASIICFFLPEKFSLDEMRSRIMSTKPYYMHHLSETLTPSYIYGLIIHSSWYVECIIWFYSIYYLSTWLSRKSNFNKTIVLSILMLGYLVGAYYYYGPQEAHYYRYPCVFLAGHIVVRWREAKWYGNALAALAILLNLWLIGIWYVVWFIVALVGLLFFSIINTRYIVTGKRILLLGAISYFFYLSHVGISWTLLCYADIKSCLAWTALTTIVAYLLYMIDSSLDKIIIRKRL